MEEQKQKPTPRKATAKDVLLAVVAIAVLLPIFWLRETGERWAVIVVAAIPIVGYLYWLRIPSEQRAKAEQQAKLELKNSKLGRAWSYFIWLLFAFAGMVVIKSIFEWVNRA